MADDEPLVGDALNRAGEALDAILRMSRKTSRELSDMMVALTEIGTKANEMRGKVTRAQENRNRARRRAKKAARKRRQT